MELRLPAAVYGKMFGSDLTALSAPQVLGTSPEMTYWAYNILMVHRSEITGYKRSKVEDARLGRESSVGYAKQNSGRAGTLCVSVQRVGGF